MFMCACVYMCARVRVWKVWMRNYFTSIEMHLPRSDRISIINARTSRILDGREALNDFRARASVCAGLVCIRLYTVCVYMNKKIDQLILKWLFMHACICVCIFARVNLSVDLFFSSIAVSFIVSFLVSFHLQSRASFHVLSLLSFFASCIPSFAVSLIIGLTSLPCCSVAHIFSCL